MIPIAALGMTLSSVSVMGHALRLKRTKLTSVIQPNKEPSACGTTPRPLKMKQYLARIFDQCYKPPRSVARVHRMRYLGLRLMLGFLLIIGAAWLFGGIAQDVLAGGALTVIDKNVARWFHERRTPGLTIAMEMLTSLASTAWVIGVGIVCALVLWRKSCWYRLLALVLVLPGGMILNFFLKITFHRQRPSFTESFLIFTGYSFPSGHTMAATLLYGLLAVFAVVALKAWHWRLAAVFGAFVMVVLVGFSRIYLGAHYPSDVLAAAAAGLAWLALSLTAVGSLHRRRASGGSSSA